MLQRIVIVLFFFSLTACQYLGDKTKKAINKTGEAIGEGSSEFAKGVANGVDNTFDSKIIIGDELKQKGITFGKFFITNDTPSSNKNQLTIYLIFEKDFNGNISAKVFDQKGTEYGRTSLNVTAKATEAKYMAFKFNLPADIESKSKFVIE